jgi:HEPN domain-containing protein
MSANEQRLKDWIEKADHDLGTAVVVNQHLPEYADVLAFHCQQAVEKYIKCLLEKNTIQFKRSHDLRYLLDLLSDIIPVTNELYEKILKLNAFSVEVRYPDIKIELSEEDRNSAISIAKEFREFLKEHVGFVVD